MNLSVKKEKSITSSTSEEILESLTEYRVLLAEDNEVNQKLATRILEKRGHNITVVENGEAAVEAHDKGTFDIILMDVQMPLMDGLEATKIIRKKENEKGGKIPIIAMTAHVLKGDKERCIESGMDDYLPKPIDANKLFEILDKYVSVKKKIPEFNLQFSDDNKPLKYEETLERLDGDTELLNEIIELYLADAPLQLEKLNQLIGKNDIEAVTRQAHTIKGSSANIGAEFMRENALQMELASKDGDFDSMKAIQKELKNEFEKLKLFLKNSCFPDSI